MGGEAKEACGVFGIYGPGEDVARITFFGLYALQHRGQESAGIATADGERLTVYAQMGLVSQVFSEDVLSKLTGHIAIGHTRYSTTGSSRVANAQPIIVNGTAGHLGLAHNGNLVNAGALRDELTVANYRFESTTDSEIIGRLIVESHETTWEGRIKAVLPRLEGAYSLVMTTADQLFGVRDPLGVRPLCLGRLNGGWVLASESCALDVIGAEFIREVRPGEVVAIDAQGVHSYVGVPSQRQAGCIFEFIYLARPDSILSGKRLYEARVEMGRQLAREYPVEADMVIGIPDSATASGIGYSMESGIPFKEVLIKSRYIGRTFIQPDQRMREAGVQMKFNPLPELLDGQRVVVVDDSIIRGTTTPRIVQLLRKAGAREVHVRITSPPYRWPCVLGVDTARRYELIAAHLNVPEIERFIGADSLGYLSIEGLVKAIGLPDEIFCKACFTGHYPVNVQLDMDKLMFERVSG